MLAIDAPWCAARQQCCSCCTPTCPLAPPGPAPLRQRPFAPSHAPPQCWGIFTFLNKAPGRDKPTSQRSFFSWLNILEITCARASALPLPAAGTLMTGPPATQAPTLSNSGSSFSDRTVDEEPRELKRQRTPRKPAGGPARQPSGGAAGQERTCRVPGCTAELAPGYNQKYRIW